MKRGKIMRKRIISGIICFLMIATLLPQNVMAAQITQEETNENIDEKNTEDNGDGNISFPDQDIQQNLNETDTTKQDEDTNHPVLPALSENLSEGELDYVYIESEEVAPDTEQNVVVVLKGAGTVQEAKLYYRNTVNPEQEHVSVPVQIDERAVHFIIRHEDLSENGYEVVLDRIEYCFEGLEEYFKITFSDQEISASYIVRDKESTEEQQGDVTVYATSEDGKTAVGNSVSEALEEIGISENAVPDSGTDEEKVPNMVTPKMAAAPALSTVLGTSGGNLVIAIDPGHDSTHSGAQGYGLGEEYINLDVALACKAELEKYSGVTVILTHSDIICPNPGNTASYDNNKRIEKAVEQGADIYVSIHMNASSNESAHGCEVYIPNNNWKPALHEEGSTLAERVLVQLQALGLNNRGFYSRDSDDGSTYPDGSVSDYYTVQNKCKQLGITGIIIEHAFISNASDAAFMADANNRTKLGVADATAIAQQFNLVKKDVLGIGSTSIGNTDSETGTVEVILKNVAAPDGIQGVCISAICDGYATKWIAAQLRDDCYVAELKISDFGDSTGPYTILGYVRDINDRLGTGTVLTKTFEFPPVIGNTVTKNVDHLSRICDVIFSVTKSYFPVTNTCVSAIGPDYITRWYPAESVGNGNYKATVNFVCDGTFSITGYARNSKGTLGTGQEISQKIDMKSGDISRVYIENTSEETGYFDVVLEGVTAARGIGSVCISAYSRDTGTKWLAAKKEAEGVYRVPNISLPKGTYQITGYMRDIVGTLITGNTLSHTVTFTEAKIGETRLENENLLDGSLDVVMSGVYAPRGIGSVCVSIWKPGMSTKWIAGKKESDGVYRASLTDLTTGNYVITGYMRDIEGTLVTGKTILKNIVISSVSIGNTEIIDKNPKTGVFKVRLTGVKTRYGVGSACVSVYNTQTGTVWVPAERTEQGTYEAVVTPERSGNYSVTSFVRDIHGTLCTGATLSCNVTIKAPGIGSTYVRNERLDTQTIDVVFDGVYSPKGVSNSCVSVYCKETGTLWYPAIKNESDEYVATVPAVNGKTYMITGYFRDINGNLYNGKTIEHKTCLVKDEISKTTIEKKNVEEGSFDITLAGVTSPKGIESVCISLTPPSGPMEWLPAEYIGNNIYSVSVTGRENGVYQVTGYARNNDGDLIIGNEITVNLTNSKPMIGDTEILKYDMTNKTFTVQLSGVEAFAGINDVCAGVYNVSEGTLWYAAEKVSDGVYHIVVPAPKITNYDGAYYVTGYVRDKEGVLGVGSKVMAYVYPDAKPDEERMWNYFNSQINNPVGTAALMGNLYWESALMANNLQNSYSIKFGLSDEEYTALVDNHALASIDPNESSDYNFVHDKAGYGLAQWTYYTRKEELLQYIRSKSVSIGNLQAQMEFLWDELCRYYPSIVNTLMTTTDIREASNQLLFNYEEPADTGIIHQDRRAERSLYYYTKFANK